MLFDCYFVISGIGQTVRVILQEDNHEITIGRVRARDCEDESLIYSLLTNQFNFNFEVQIMAMEDSSPDFIS